MKKTITSILLLALVVLFCPTIVYGAYVWSQGGTNNTGPYPSGYVITSDGTKFVATATSSLGITGGGTSTNFWSYNSSTNTLTPITSTSGLIINGSTTLSTTTMLFGTDSLKFYDRNIGGSLISSKFPFISSVGSLNGSPLNGLATDNALVIRELEGMGDPSIVFVSADFGDTLNGAIINFDTSTDSLNINNYFTDGPVGLGVSGNVTVGSTSVSSYPLRVIGTSSLDSLIVGGLNGILKGVGGVVTTASTGTDYLDSSIFNISNTWLGTNSFSVPANFNGITNSGNVTTTNLTVNSNAAILGRLSVNTTSIASIANIQGSAGSPALTVSSSTGSSVFFVDSTDNTTISSQSKVKGTSLYLGSNLNVYENNLMTANVGGIINMGGVYNTTDLAQIGFAQIGGFKENTTNNNANGYLALFTTLNGTGSQERARITSAGLFGIGTSTPNTTLNVFGSGSTAPFSVSSSSLASMLYLNPDGYFGINQSTPSYYLDVYQSGAGGEKTIAHFQNNGGTSAGTGAAITFGDSTSLNSTQGKIAVVRTNTPVNGDADMTFSTGGSVTPTEKVRIKSNGNLLVGTSAATSTVFIQGTGGQSYPMFSVASSSGTTVFSIGKNGHEMTGGTAPTLSSCGTGSPTISGDDSTMRIIVGGGVQTTCLVTFANPWINLAGNNISPVCMAEQEVGVPSVNISASSTPTTLLLTTTVAGFGGQQISVFCRGSNNFTY